MLTRHSDRIQRVVVRLGDENGPRGGVDKFCRIQVHLLDAPVAVIGDLGADLYAVIDRATDRVARVVVKHLDRSRIDRRPGRVDAHLIAPEELAPTPDPAHPELKSSMKTEQTLPMVVAQTGAPSTLSTNRVRRSND